MARFCMFLAVGLALALPSGVAMGKADPAEAKKPPVALVGILVKVDGQKIVVKTHGKTAGEVTVTTDAKTAFEVKGKPATLADLKAGHEVVVTPATGTAQRVIVPGDGKKKKKK